MEKQGFPHYIDEQNNRNCARERIPTRRGTNTVDQVLVLIVAVPSATNAGGSQQIQFGLVSFVMIYM